jgi:hypothetical protein
MDASRFLLEIVLFCRTRFSMSFPLAATVAISATPVLPSKHSCSNFIWQNQPIFAHQSVGAWVACETCVGLIEGDRWAELTDGLFNVYTVPRHEQLHVREQRRQIHQL